MNSILVNRLKEKLGTRMVPTAELTLDGTLAIPVMGLTDGIKNITPMLSITRTWNAICAVGGMRHGLALAKDYAKRRVAFGAPLSEKPLHVDTLAGLEAEYEGAFLLTFRAVELLGKDEAGELGEHEAALLRLLTPIVKLTTAKQAVAVASEVLESFGGAGYVEDTGLPRLLRDAQVLPIWEGTTNVLSLDLLRALAKGGSLEPIAREVHAAVEGADVSLKAPAEAAVRAVEHAQSWLMKTMEGGPQAVEAGARRLALTLGRALELGFLVREATRSKKRGDDAKPAAAARRFAEERRRPHLGRVARRGRADPARLRPCASALRDEQNGEQREAEHGDQHGHHDAASGRLSGHLLRGGVVLVELGELEGDARLARGRDEQQRLEDARGEQRQHADEEPDRVPEAILRAPCGEAVEGDPAREARRLALREPGADDACVMHVDGGVRREARGAVAHEDGLRHGRAGHVLGPARLARDDEPVEPGRERRQLEPRARRRVAGLGRHGERGRDHAPACVVELGVDHVARIRGDEHDGGGLVRLERATACG